MSGLIGARGISCFKGVTCPASSLFIGAAIGANIGCGIGTDIGFGIGAKISVSKDIGVSVTPKPEKATERLKRAHQS